MDVYTALSFVWLGLYALHLSLWTYLGFPPQAHPYLHGLADGAFAVLCLRCVGEYLATRRHHRRRTHQ